jgi:hypothetical protein
MNVALEIGSFGGRINSFANTIPSICGGGGCHKSKYDCDGGYLHFLILAS